MAYAVVVVLLYAGCIRHTPAVKQPYAFASAFGMAFVLVTGRRPKWEFLFSTKLSLSEDISGVDVTTAMLLVKKSYISITSGKATDRHLSRIIVILVLDTTQQRNRLHVAFKPT